MNATPNGAVDQTMAKLQAIADRLQRGEITLEEADAESRLVHASLVRELTGPAAENPASRMRMAPVPARGQEHRWQIFQPRYRTDSFPSLGALWTTLVLLCCVVGGLAIMVRGIQLGMTLQATLFCTFVTSGGLLYYSRYHPSRTLLLPLKVVVGVLCLASIAGLVVARKMGA